MNPYPTPGVASSGSSMRFLSTAAFGFAAGAGFGLALPAGAGAFAAPFAAGAAPFEAGAADASPSAIKMWLQALHLIFLPCTAAGPVICFLQEGQVMVIVAVMSSSS